MNDHSARMPGCALAVGLCALLLLSGMPAAHAAEPAGTEDFALHLQRVGQRQLLRGLAIDGEIVEDLARGRMQRAVASLEAKAAAGDPAANVALVRIQRTCARIVNQPAALDMARVEKVRSELPADKGARVASVLLAYERYMKAAQPECRSAPFALREIEARLRAAAARNDAVSATELARFTGDPAQRESLLIVAADVGYAPAQHALASARVAAVQRGLSTENVASIRVLLKQAGQTIPAAKLDFANCVALGCDGHPSDVATAAVFGVDAARDGEPGAFPAMLRMPWRARLRPPEVIAWQYFGEQLNDAGCSADGYVGSAVSFAQTLAQLAKGAPADLLTQGRALADQYWKDFGARARREQLCE